MSETVVPVAISDHQTVTAVLTESEVRAASWIFIYAPGAGSNVYDPFGCHLSRRLPASGVAVARFQFPYMELGKRWPDRPAVLEEVWRAAVEVFRGRDRRLLVGGRSMGGRIASQIVSAGTLVDAVALFAYPLHPPGNPLKTRDEHLPAIKVPTLFCSGTRDAFGSREELEAISARVKASTVRWLDAADHGFNVPKSSGRSGEQVQEEAIGALMDWLSSI